MQPHSVHAVLRVQPQDLRNARQAFYPPSYIPYPHEPKISWTFSHLENKIGLGMGAHDFNLSTGGREGRNKRISELGASLVNRESSRTVRAAQGELVSKNKTTTK